MSYCIIMISLPSALNFFTYTVQLSVSSHANMEDFALLQEIVDVLMGGVDSIVKMVGIDAGSRNMLKVLDDHPYSAIMHDCAR